MALEQQLTTWLRRYPQRFDVVNIIRDLSVVVRHLDDIAATDPSIFESSKPAGDWILPLIQRCLELIPEDINAAKEPGFFAQEALRHGLILFLQPIRRRFGIHTGNTDARVCKLGAALSQCRPDWDGLRGLLRWIMVVGGLESAIVEDQSWFARTLASHARLVRESKAGVLKSVIELVWMSETFDSSLQRFIYQMDAEDLKAASDPCLSPDSVLMRERDEKHYGFLIPGGPLPSRLNVPYRVQGVNRTAALTHTPPFGRELLPL